MDNSIQTWILTAHCPSKSGTVDVVTRYLANAGHYINEIQSFDDRATGQFFIRIEFTPALPDFDPLQFDSEFGVRARDFSMEWNLTASGHRMRMAILVSKYDHCLNDLLYRYRTGQLNVEVPVIISNHPDLEELAKWPDRKSVV